VGKSRQRERQRRVKTLSWRPRERFLKENESKSTSKSGYVANQREATRWYEEIIVFRGKILLSTKEVRLLLLGKALEGMKDLKRRG